MSRLELRHVAKTFSEKHRETPALNDISFTVQPGEFVVMIGPSGSGKSTVFNLITGLLRPDRGEVILDGELINGRTGLVGYMPQRDLLLPWRNVLDNVTLGPQIAGKPREAATRRAYELLPLFGLDSFAKAYPATLSGGMRQRAALLRTFLLERDILLLDEPFGALDALTRRDLQLWLLEVWAQFKTTILFITHDVHEAVLLADRVLVLSARPGRLEHEMPLDLPRPRDEISPAFIQAEAALLQFLSVPRESR